jgi:SAM-dependent methyltransferase
MTAVNMTHLEGLYAGGDDPWHFRTSAYEVEKFAATCAALPRAHYHSVLEIGCGNGELARHIARRCSHYTGVDAVQTALEAARRAVPRGRFERQFLPAVLPEGAYDLLLCSEILYFLDPQGIAQLARQIDRRWPLADVVCVTWRGPSGNALQGEEAFNIFAAQTTRRFRQAAETADYRIDVAGGPDAV